MYELMNGWGEGGWGGDQDVALGMDQADELAGGERGAMTERGLTEGRTVPRE